MFWSIGDILAPIIDRCRRDSAADHPLTSAENDIPASPPEPRAITRPTAIGTEHDAI